MPRRYSVPTVFLVPSQLLSSPRCSQAVRSRDLEWFYVNLPGISPNSCRSARPVHARVHPRGWDAPEDAKPAALSISPGRLSLLGPANCRVPRENRPSSARSVRRFLVVSPSTSEPGAGSHRSPPTPHPQDRLRGFAGLAHFCGEEKPRGSGSESLGVRLLAKHFNLR